MILLVVGLVALSKSDLSSDSSLYSVWFPAYTVFFLGFQFVDFIISLKRSGVITSNWDGEFSNLFNLLYAEREEKYKGLFSIFGSFGVLFVIAAVWLDIGALVYGVAVTFQQVGLIVNS